MNTKTTLAFSTASIIALVLLFAFGPIVGDHQAFAYGWYDGHSGYYGHWGGYYGPATTAATVARRRGNILNIGGSKSGRVPSFFYFFETKYIKFYIL